MGNRNQLSVPEKLLLAAYELEERGRKPFSAEDLVVAAWKKFPDTFGLGGHKGEDSQLLYPDSNRVFAEIMGTKPIRKRGLLVKVGNKVYQLTETGREHARLLLSRLSISPIQKSGLARDIQRELKRLFTSRATEKYRNGRIPDITFYDACAFWGISPRSSAIEFNGRIANFNGILDVARRAIQEKQVTFKHGGEVFSSNDLDDLNGIHHEMLKMFNKEINIISGRTDERK